MTTKMKTQCPVCNGKLLIKEMECPDCNIIIKGNIEGISSDSPQHLLNNEEWHFVIQFLLCEGNLKCLGEKLNKSYPTLKNKLQEIKEKLPGYKIDSDNVDNVLDLIESGKMDLKQALNKLKRRK